MAVASALLREIEQALTLERPSWNEAYGDADWPQAAVLVALTDEDSPRVLLGRRAQHLPLHPGEIAFAGGKREPEDPSPWDTALREAWEEVGLLSRQVCRLGEMHPLVTRTGFYVFPCVGAIAPHLDFTVDPAEFDSVFQPELATFADNGIFRLEAISLGEQTRMVPHYQVGDDDVWGVTAAVLAQLANVAYDAGFDLQRDWENAP